MNNEKYNWKGILLISIPSAALGVFVDLLLNFNNYSFLISTFLPIIMLLIYRPYLIETNASKGKIKPIRKWRHTLFTLIMFIFLARTIFGLISVILGVPLNALQNDSNLFIMISITSIILGNWGDEMISWLLKAGKLDHALDNKSDFFSQDHFKIMVYFFYLLFIFITNIGVKSEYIQLGISTFATFVAFERLWKFLKERKKKNAAASKAYNDQSG